MGRQAGNKLQRRERVSVRDRREAKDSCAGRGTHGRVSAMVMESVQGLDHRDSAWRAQNTQSQVPGGESEPGNEGRSTCQGVHLLFRAGNLYVFKSTLLNLICCC